MELACYRCGSTHQLEIDEKMDKETGEVMERKFVCIRCSDKIMVNVSSEEVK